MPNSDTSILAGDQTAVRLIPQRITDAWATGDADAFAAVFTEDASMVLPGGVFHQGREDIRTFMAAGYAGPYRGLRVFGEAVAVKFVGPGVCVVITQGGVLTPGETTVAPGRGIRATWVLVRRDGGWLVTAYQNTPLPAV